MSTNYVSRVALAAISCTGLIVGLLNAVPAQAQTPTTVYGFPGTPGPVNPNIEALTQGRDGELYLTAAGGDGKALNCTVTYCGAAFKITPAGAVSDLFDFSNNNCTVVLCGYDAYGGLTLGTDGNFYGAFYEGGNTGTLGAVFKLTPAGVLTLLHSFTGVSDGSHPYGAPIEGTNGIFYGTTTSASNNSTAYSVTSAGVFKTLHTFTGTDGQNVYAPLVQGTDGNFYGNSFAGGKSNDGVIFKMAPSGTVTVLHNFAGTDGSEDYYPLIQASDGNFYGTSYAGGTDSAGVVFKITPSGTYTVLHNINGTTDGNGPAYGLVQATNGKLYGVTAGPIVTGTIYSITTSGTFTTLYTFTGGADGNYPLSPMVQHTDGLLYGTTDIGGNVDGCSTDVNEEIYDGCGEVFSLNIGAKPFIRLSSTSGKVGSTVGIFGQEFDSKSVVKFNGVAATKIVLTGTTYITATVPAGATDGKVTVTTGVTTLTSTQTFIVHNSWGQGKAMPTPVAFATSAVLNGEIYLVGGYPGTGYSGAVGDNQIYNPATNTWSSGPALTTGTAQAAAAVVNDILYIFGGSNDGGPSVFNTVWAYNPKTKAWSSKAAMPTARCSLAATVENNIIYVIGGYASGVRLDTVEAYNPATDTWKEEAPLSVGKSEPSVGLVGTTIVAADGYDGTSDNGDNEAYDAATNKWTSLKADPNPRNAACGGAIGSNLYVAGGGNKNGPALNSTESFTLTTNTWTTLDPMLQGSGAPSSAVYNGQLYCIGGWASSPDGTLLNKVQIYQP